MKIKDLNVQIPALKPRDPNQRVLASKRNAGGPMRDKKQEAKRGVVKHKGREDAPTEVSEGWMNHKDGKGTFTADMSEVSAHGANPRCPGCSKQVKLRDFTAHRDGEGDVSYWSLKHECGANLKVWNT